MLRVLCVRFSSIGDVLLTTPLIRALRARHPDAELYFVTKQAMAPLVTANPHLNAVVELGPQQSLGDLARRLRALQPTHALDLHGSMRSTALRLLVRARWSGYSKRKIARRALIASKIDLYGRHVPVPERYFEAARALDVRPDGRAPEFFIAAPAQERVGRWLEERGLSNRPFAALAPGAAHATKRWPLAHWQRLVRQLEERGLGVVALGGSGDSDVAAQLGGSVANAAGAFGLQETGACLTRARVLVSGDTGVMHMATGVGTRVVALFGPTVKAFGFFPYDARAVVLEREMSCRPCSAMGSARCPLGHHRCLDDILPDHVTAAVERLVA